MLLIKSLNKCGDKGHTLSLLLHLHEKLRRPATCYYITGAEDKVRLAKRRSSRESGLGVNWYWNITNTAAVIASSLMTSHIDTNTRNISTLIHTYTHIHTHSLWCVRGTWELLTRRENEVMMKKRASSNELLTWISEEELEETCLAAGLKNISLSFTWKKKNYDLLIKIKKMLQTLAWK